MNDPRKLLLAAGFLLLAHLALGAPEQPNVLLIITDDQGYGDLSLHGSPYLETPHMDRIGQEGVRLDQFYVSPVCAPTRASLLTGRYHMRTGATSVTRRREVIDPEETTLAEVFRDNGYRTGCFGKWHNGSFYPETPRGQGFDEDLGFHYGVFPVYFDPVLQHNGKPVRKEGYITDILTEGALDFMEGASKGGEPFFCYLSYNAPHTPALVPEPYFQRFKEQYLGDREAALHGMVANLDDNIGRLLVALREWGIEEETLILFMTDNGPNSRRYNAGMKGRKAHYDEGGVRVPAFLRWPGSLESGTRVERRLAHIDILPTLADLLGLDGTADLELDGRSFRALLEDPHAPWPDRVLMTFPFGQGEVLRQRGAARTERWAAVMRDGQWKLYDLLADPRQTTDVKDHYPWVMETLEARYWERFEDVTAGQDFGPTPIPVGHPEAPEIIMEGHDATLVNQDEGGIGYNFWAGFAHHWINGWTNPRAYPEWLGTCVSAGEYEIALQYAMAEENAGVRLEVAIAGEVLPVRIDTPFDPEPVEQPWIVPDEADKYASKDWRFQPVGTVILPEGPFTVRVRLIEYPGEASIELKGVRLVRR